MKIVEIGNEPTLLLSYLCCHHLNLSETAITVSCYSMSSRKKCYSDFVCSSFNTVKHYFFAAS